VEYFAIGIVKFTGTWKYVESSSVPFASLKLTVVSLAVKSVLLYPGYCDVWRAQKTDWPVAGPNLGFRLTAKVCPVVEVNGTAMSSVML